MVEKLGPPETIDISPSLKYVEDTGRLRVLEKNGRWLTQDTFRCVAEDAGFTLHSATYTHTRLATLIAEAEGASERFREIVQTVNFEERLRAILLKTDRVADLLEQVDLDGSRYGLGAKSRVLTEEVLRTFR